MKAPTLTDVLAARQTIRPHLPETSLQEHPLLSRLVGTTTLVKHENQLPVGAFKVRGGVNLAARLSPEERERGIVSASTGNHGLSLAFGGRIYGIAVRIIVPENANPMKVAAIRELGAEVVHHGADFDEGREEAERLGREEGFRYVHSGDEPDLIAGVATATLEVLEAQPEVEVIVVPVGGGSGAAGACIVAKAMNPNIEVIGVQSEAAPCAFLSWRAKALIPDETATFAEGLSTRTPFALPQRIMWDLLDDFILVSDRDLRDATVKMIELAHNLVEPAGAAALAGALKLGARLHGKLVVLMCTGGNINPAQLRDLLA